MKPKLNVLRKRAGFKSASAFAESIGMSPKTYTNYEQGARKLSLEQAWEFADILGCSIDEIAGRRRPEHEPVYADERQSVLNMNFEKLNDGARDRALSNMIDMVGNPTNLISKSGESGQPVVIRSTA